MRHPKGFLGGIGDERMAEHCLESECIGLYVTPLGSVRI